MEAVTIHHASNELVARAGEAFASGCDVVVSVDGPSAAKLSREYHVGTEIVDTFPWWDDPDLSKLWMLSGHARVGATNPILVRRSDAERVELLVRYQRARSAPLADPAESDDPVFRSVMAIARRADNALGDDLEVVAPPDTYPRCEALPERARVFATLGVDGVHFALLSGESMSADDPVVEITPTEDSACRIVAASFASFVARGADVEIDVVQAAAGKGGSNRVLAAIVSDIQYVRAVRSDATTRRLTKKYADRIGR